MQLRILAGRKFWRIWWGEYVRLGQGRWSLYTVRGNLWVSTNLVLLFALPQLLGWLRKSEKPTRWEYAYRVKAAVCMACSIHCQRYVCSAVASCISGSHVTAAGCWDTLMPDAWHLIHAISLTSHLTRLTSTTWHLSYVTPPKPAISLLWNALTILMAVHRTVFDTSIFLVPETVLSASTILNPKTFLLSIKNDMCDPTRQCNKHHSCSATKSHSYLALFCCVTSLCPPRDTARTCLCHTSTDMAGPSTCHKACDNYKWQWRITCHTVIIHISAHRSGPAISHVIRLYHLRHAWTFVGSTKKQLCAATRHSHVSTRTACVNHTALYQPREPCTCTPTKTATKTFMCDCQLHTERCQISRCLFFAFKDF